MKRIICQVLIILILLSGCVFNKNKTSSATQFIFDTVCNITIDNGTKKVLDGAFSLCQKYDDLFSKTKPKSDVSQLNNSNGEFIAVNSDTYKLLETAKKYSAFSNGKFDITVASLTKLWNFTEENPTVPNNEEIKRALVSVNYNNIILNNGKVKLLNNSKVDLGGIAKGFVADKIIEYFSTNNVDSGVLNLGGNVVVFGKEKNIGIQKPFAANGEYSAVVKADNVSVVTSGNYQRYFEIDNKIYHHILDTENGYPIDNNLNSVTIISKNSVDGDALSTACFSLGIDASKELLKNFDGVEAIFITKDNNIIVTSGLSVTNNESPVIMLKS